MCSPDCLRAVEKRALQMCHGFKPTRGKRLVPVDGHMGTQLFQTDKMTEHIGRNFTYSSTGALEEIKSDKISSFAQSLDANMCASGKYGAAGSSVAGSLKAELGISSSCKTKMHMAQIRKTYIFGSVQLPDAKMELKRVQEMMNPAILKKLNSVSSKQQATQIVASVGPYFIHQASFGATYVMTATMEKKSWTDSASLGTKLKAEFSTLCGGAEMSAELNMKSDTTGEESNATVVIRGDGGDPVLIRTEDRWNEAAKKYPIVIQYQLIPLYHLIDTALPARVLVEGAFKTWCEGQQDIIAELEASLKEPKAWFSESLHYNLRSVETGLSVNMNIGPRTYKHVMQWSYPQTFRLRVSSGGGTSPVVILKSDATGRYLGTEGHSNADPIVQKLSLQLWVMSKVGVDASGSPIVTFAAKSTGLFLNMHIGEARNGGGVFQWNYPQKFLLEYQSGPRV